MEKYILKNICFFVLFVLMSVGVAFLIVYCIDNDKKPNSNIEFQTLNQEIDDISSQLNTLIENNPVVNNDVKMNIASPTDFIEEKFFPLDKFLELTDNYINADNCFVNGEFVSPIESGDIENIADKKYVNLENVAPKLGYALNFNDKQVELNRSFSSKRIMVKADSLKNKYGAKNIIKIDDCILLQYATELETKIAFESLKKDYIVEVDAQYELSDEFCGVGNNENTPNYIWREYNSWGGDAMGFSEYETYLTKTCKELNDVIAVVIDTGIYAEHSLLQGRVSEYSKSFVNKDPKNLQDNVGHGTHIAGTIAEFTPKNVKIMSLKIANSPFINMSAVYTSYVYVLKLMNLGVPIKVVNASYGGLKLGYNTVLHKLKIDKIKEKGALFCVAAGNSSDNANKYTPAYIESALTVSAIDEQHELASFSSFGNVVDFAAPGVHILSAYHKSNQYIKMSGTSMACPHVVSAVAMLASNSNENYTNYEIEQILKTKACIDLGESGKDSQFGYGLIDLSKLAIEKDYAGQGELKEYKVFLQNECNMLNEFEKSVSTTKVQYFDADGKKRIISNNEHNVTMVATIHTNDDIMLDCSNNTRYKFSKWIVADNQNFQNAKTYFDIMTTIKDWQSNNLYIKAVLKLDTMDVKFVLNFVDDPKYNGYIGYGAKLNLSYYNFVNDKFVYTKKQFNSTPRESTFCIKNVPIDISIKFEYQITDGALKYIVDSGEKDRSQYGFQSGEMYLFPTIDNNKIEYTVSIMIMV